MASQRPTGLKADRLGLNRGEIGAALRRLGPQRALMPATLRLELASLVREAPDGDDWIHEIKFDGYRMLCRIEAGAARFISRNELDWTAKFSRLATEAVQLPVATAILDGEVVALQANGISDFQTLQNSLRSGGSARCVYYAFDLLYLNGRDVRSLAIEARKELLRRVIPVGTESALRYSDHLLGKGPAVYAEACRRRLEGIISKRCGRPYLGGRGADWLKVKCTRSQEFVIVGFTVPSGSRTHFGALLLGFYNRQRRLVYAGRVGTGFDDRTLSSLHRKLSKRVRPTSPLENPPRFRGVTWVKPQLVAQVTFSNWTNDGLLRHPSFQGLREDKSAAEVTADVVLANPSGPRAERQNGKTLPKL